MRIALLGNIGLTENEASTTLEQIASRIGVGEIEVKSFDNAIDLMDSISSPSSEWLFDLAVLAQDSPGMTGVEIASELRSISSNVRIVLVADSATWAFDASKLDVNGYLLRPITSEAFDRTMLVQLNEIALWHKDSVLLRFRDRPHRIRLTDIMYAQTDDHDQIILMRDGTQRSMRVSSQGLFDELSHDGRFFKMGSSYIVNLNEVRELNNGILTFTDGKQLNVPVRIRKPLEDELMM